MAAGDCPPLIDVLGRAITVGATVVYAANVYGHREALRRATVVSTSPRLVVRAEVPQRPAGFAKRTVVLRDPRRTVVITEDEPTMWLRRQLAALGVSS